jgi:endo-1,4-beta-xylanase
MSTPDRRAWLGGAAALALAGCSRAEALDPPRGPPPALRDLAPFPVGTAAASGLFADPAWTALALRQVSQLTPEWEMKMESILRDDGGFDFTHADRIAAFCRTHSLRLFGHTLIWHAQAPPALRRLDGNRAAFELAVRNYIAAVAGHYRGQAVGWDVVNEAVAEDGHGLRDCIYGRNLGPEDYMVLAFQCAREADPQALLLINDYNLEIPAKRATFLRLVERLLRRGAPVGGIGVQSHLDLANAPGASRTALRELASLGLPIHVSELDVSLHGGGRFDLGGRGERLARQAQHYGEVMDAFLGLPTTQRFAFTTWGLRDKDSWLTRPDRPPGDAPLPFDDAGQPKPAFWALAQALERRT